MSFTKGLEHCPDTGLVRNADDFRAFRKAVDDAFIDAFTLNVPVPEAANGDKRRKWEAPTAGIVYDLQGPDARAVTMPPAPALGSDELAYEMAEVYELALIRDEPLTALQQGAENPKVKEAVDRLNALAYNPAAGRGRPRKTDANGKVAEQTVFRGSSPGVEIGPYLSQFMLIGNVDQTKLSKVADGKISYGALQVDQRVPVAEPKNYMTSWQEWLAVQNGFQKDPELFSGQRRFITKPRDLATYVHYDALYEAYLNACLILLGMGTPFDPGFGALSGAGPLVLAGPAGRVSYERHTGGFALYGGPHILTLVTEVATRALKAVRFQKFNNHIRLRPEALAARVARARMIEHTFPTVVRSNGQGYFTKLAHDLEATVGAVKALNRQKNGHDEALLPMAFQEGSPMHPSYGAGHAAVAGACVTILKAYFDTNTVFLKGERNGKPVEGFLRHEAKTGPEIVKDAPIAYVPNDEGSRLNPCQTDSFLTLEGELNKLAANISVGRNMAGVHYFSDYYDSLRMGEEIAIGMLEEQALCYPTDSFVVTVPTFDGGVRRIGRR